MDTYFNSNDKRQDRDRANYKIYCSFDKLPEDNKYFSDVHERKKNAERWQYLCNKKITNENKVGPHTDNGEQYIHQIDDFKFTNNDESLKDCERKCSLDRRRRRLLQGPGPGGIGGGAFGGNHNNDNDCDEKCMACASPKLG